MIPVLLILASWYVNALMDAIDHGKGARTLFELWHILKAISYFSLFVYILIIEKVPLILVIALAIFMYGWELIYGYARRKNFQELDDKFKCKYIQWIWGIKRE